MLFLQMKKWGPQGGRGLSCVAHQLGGELGRAKTQRWVPTDSLLQGRTFWRRGARLYS